MRHYLNSAPKGHPQYVARPVALGHGSAVIVSARIRMATSRSTTTVRTAAHWSVIGAYSGAFERAAVIFGVGQYLDVCNAPWVAVDDRRQVPASEMPAILHHDMARHAGHRS
jgi:hypothetical protein